MKEIILKNAHMGKPTNEEVDFTNQKLVEHLTQAINSGQFVCALSYRDKDKMCHLQVSMGLTPTQILECLKEHFIAFKQSLEGVVKK